MKIDLVCSGGGVKGIALLGAIDFLQEEGFEFVEVAGTSVGAVIGAFLQAGYRAREILYIIQSEQHAFSFVPKKSFSNRLRGLKGWVELYWKLGLYSSDDLERTLEEYLGKNGVVTFLDLCPNALQIVASDLTRQAIVVFPRDIDEYESPQPLSIAKAVCMSATVPFFFHPRYLIHKEMGEKCMLVDGGILSNFPMWLFDRERARKTRPVIGLQLQSDMDTELAPKIHTALGLMRQMMQTMQVAHDRAYIRKQYARNIVFIPVGQIEATDFFLGESDIQHLFESGRESCKKFLRTWSY